MPIEIEPFRITIHIALKSYSMNVRQCYVGAQVERFEVSANSKFIIFESNRPALRSQGLSKRQPSWKVRESSQGLNLWNQSALDAIKNELWQHIKSIEQAPFNWKDHPKNN